MVMGGRNQVGDFVTNPSEETPSCKLCGGVGKTKEPAEDTWKQCVCSFTRGLRQKLGPELVAAKLLEDSPLFDRTKENLHIKADWATLTGHLKYVLMQKNYEFGLHYYCNIVTDERLFHVWIGDESYKSKSRKKRDEVDTHNTISDVAGANQDLVIIRLGFLGHPNRAMPGVLKETLLLRQGLAKPTWVVSDPEFPPYTEGHFSWSPDVGKYIAERYKDLDLLPEGAKFASTYLSASPTPGMFLAKEDDLLPPPWEQKVPKVLDPLLEKSSKFKKNRGGPV